MDKFDTILYGNGLTIAVLSDIKEISDSIISKYLSCADFITDFTFAAPHKRVIREFNKYFELNRESLKEHKKARNILRENSEEIVELGFERWVSKNMFNEKLDINKIKIYFYILYNYWFHIINEEILSKLKTKKYLEKIGTSILGVLKKNGSIYTTNFDNLLDEILKPQHIHGIFHIPLDRLSNIILKHYNKNEYEYKYLFGTNGWEKLYRLAAIRNIRQNCYDLDFFYDDSINLGHLLVYGIAFGKAEFLSEDFIKQFPEHNKNKLVKTVDGHILYKLLIRFQKKQLQKITIAYYSKLDKKNYEELFDSTEIEEIIEYKRCDEIIKWENAL